MEFMSQEGYDKLVAELKEMVEVELPKVIEAVAEARDKGDLSENFEYHAAKREQGRLLGRIKFKQNILANTRVLPSSSMTTDSVQLLSRVELTNLNTQKQLVFTIVSPHEADIKQGKISVKSPIAQALKNRRKGETVEVRVPAGLLRLRIDNITI
ncbi:MAG: transcription elongation factor GreA [Prevotella sp.]|jgi:transcription elongation factor GreA